MRVVCLQTGPLDYCVEFAAAAARRVELLLIGAAAELEPIRDQLPAELAVAPLPWPRHRSLANLRLLRDVLARIREHRPAVVHFLGDSTLWLNLALPFLRHLPRVVTIHDVHLHPGDVQSRRVPRLTVHQLRRAATLLVVHGPDQRRQAIAQLGRPASEVVVLPHPALSRYARLAARAGLARRPGGPPRVLFFGRLMRYKGLAVLLEAWPRVAAARPGAELLVAGSGPDAAWLARACEGLAGVRLEARRLADLETAQAFLDADLVVLPYIEASQSGVLALAAAFGRPVVASDVGDLATTVRETGMGRLVPPGDPAALAQALLALLADPEERGRLARASAAAAEGPLSAATVGALAAELYADALARRAGRLAA
jgi:glycosyltransferase involved in cell wall biosynthesis